VLATDAIVEHIDVKRLLEHYNFDKITHNGDTLRACCKLHGGNSSSAFVIDEERGRWFCHTGECGAGDVFTLIEKMEGIEFPQAVKWVADFFDVDISNLKIIERKKDYVRELDNWIKIVKGKKKTNTNIQEFHIKEDIRSVTSYRNFKEETLKHFALGYVERVELKKLDGEKYELHKRLIIPIMQDGLQIGISFRRTRSNDFPKWSHQPYGFKSSKTLYNFDKVKDKNEIIVVEGMFDVWAFYEIGLSCVATFGSHLTDEQYKLLFKTGADLVIAYDNDKAGNIAKKKFIEKFKYKANLSVITFPPGKDACDVNRGELRELYEGRTRT